MITKAEKAAAVAVAAAAEAKAAVAACAASRRFRQAHPEKVRAYNRDYDAAHPEVVAKRLETYRKTHRVQLAAKERARYWACKGGKKVGLLRGLIGRLLFWRQK